jgi:hypothetical protein
MAGTAASSRALTDHDEIRRWAEQRGAKPACVRGTGSSGDAGMIRLDFPGYTGDDKLEEISWDEWFDKFDESGLALLVEEKTARGQQSNFNKLVSREIAGPSQRRTSSRSTNAGDSHSRSREGRGYRLSSSYSNEEIEGMDEDRNMEEQDMQEEMDLEESRPAGGAGNARNRRQRSRATGRKRTASARSTTSRRRTSQAGRSRNQRSTRARAATSKRGQASAGSRSGKKAPARARSAASRSSRSRSTSRRAA